MSASRESVILIILVNLVLTTLVVAGALVFFSPQEKAPAPSQSEELKEGQQALLSQIARLREENEALKLAVENRLLALEQAPRALADGAGPEDGELEGATAGAAKKELTPEERMMQTAAAMMQQQMKRGRDRFINELMNPTPQSIERNQGRLRGLVSRAARNLGLSEGDRTAVEQIVLDVDARRQDELRNLFSSKESVDDVKYSELKEVLDRSFEEEDDLVSQTLAPEQADQYIESAKGLRNFIYMASQFAFPEGEGD